MPNTKYHVFPKCCDGIPTQPEPIALGDVQDHIVKWITRYAAQGYYSNARQERIPLAAISFEIVPTKVKDEAELLVDALNALNDPFWKASYEYPGYCGVYPRDSKIDNDTGNHLSWAWGYDGSVVSGNDNQGIGNAECFDRNTPDGQMPDYHADAKQLIGMMHKVALLRCAWLTQFVEKAVGLLEVVQKAHVDYTGISGVVNCWRQR